MPFIILKFDQLISFIYKKKDSNSTIIIKQYKV